MNQPQPTEQIVITHPKDADGQDVKYSFMLTLSKRIEKDLEGRLIQAVGTLDGIDNLQPNMGRYTIGITVARSFDPDEVITELKRRLEADVLSDIVRPTLVVPE